MQDNRQGRVIRQHRNRTGMIKHTPITYDDMGVICSDCESEPHKGSGLCDCGKMLWIDKPSNYKA